MDVLRKLFLPPNSHGETALSVSVMYSTQTAAELAFEHGILPAENFVDLLETPLNFPCVFVFNLKYIFLAILAGL